LRIPDLSAAFCGLSAVRWRARMLRRGRQGRYDFSIPLRQPLMATSVKKTFTAPAETQPKLPAGAKLPSWRDATERKARMLVSIGRNGLGATALPGSIEAKTLRRAAKTARMEKDPLTGFERRFAAKPEAMAIEVRVPEKRKEASV
jgi:hypothetical protein